MRVALVAVLVCSIGCRTTAGKIAGTIGVVSALGGAAMVADGSSDGSTEYRLGLASVVFAGWAFLTAAGSELIPSPSHWTGAGETTFAAGTSGAGDASTSATGASSGVPAASSAALARDRNSYDGTGAYAGRTDANGNRYDAAGAYAGRVDEHQSYYDGTGAYQGRLDSNGEVYDRTGASSGRIDDNGNIYDKTGAFAGHVDGPCDAACKQAAAARVLAP